MPDQDVAKHRLRESVDAVSDKAIGEKVIVDGVVLVSLAGASVYERAVGFADREARMPARTNTIFRWSSLTKIVTTTQRWRWWSRG